jgi:hypothetical protein
MNPVPFEAGGGSAGAVGASWRRHELERHNRASERSRDLLIEAETWLGRFPEFVTTDGTVCFVAIEALLHLRREYGAGQVTRGMVRRAWVNALRRKDMDWYVADFLPQLNTEGIEGGD